MRKRNIYFIISIMVVCFASIATTLIINGGISIASNEGDFDVYFSEAIIDNVNKSNSAIGETRKTLNFQTKELSLVGETSILDYEVTNNSRQYDALVELKCMAASEEILDYVTIETNVEKEIIPAKEKARGTVKATLKKAYPNNEKLSADIECNIGVKALEKDEANDNVIKNTEYYTYGYLIKDDAPVTNAVVLLSSKNKIIKTTDGRGMIIFDSLEGGDYDLYIFEGLTENELNSKTEEELTSLASDHVTFNTSDELITLKNYEFRYSKIVAGIPVLHKLTINTNSGTEESINSTLIEGQGIGYLPTVKHENLLFNNWQANDTVVDNTSVFNEDTVVNATFDEGVAKIGEKHFTTLNQAFAYVTTPTETTIDVIKDNSLESSITNDKNIILNLNEKKVQFNNDNINNSGNLSIKNGSIDASGTNVFNNTGTLNLTDNLNLNYENNLVEDTELKLITNAPSAELNISNTSITASSPGIANRIENFLENTGTTVLDTATITLKNMNIDNVSGTTTINNSSITGARVENSGEAPLIDNLSTLELNETNLSYLEENVEGNNLIISEEDSTLIINSGNYDETYGKKGGIVSKVSSNVSIGENGKETNFIKNSTSTSYSITFYGNLNIIDGTINFKNGRGLCDYGKLTIGSLTTTPTINAEEGDAFIFIDSNADNIIKNVNLTVKNIVAMSEQVNSNLTIDNMNFVQENSKLTGASFYLAGNTVINGGNYKISEANQACDSLVYLFNKATLTINEGTMDYRNAKSNCIQTFTGSTLNIGKKDKNIEFIGQENAKYFGIQLEGDFFINDGIITYTNGGGFYIKGKTVIGSESATPTINCSLSDGADCITVYSTEDNTVKNANINIHNGVGFHNYSNSNLTIENVNIIVEDSVYNETDGVSRAIDNNGNLIINDGTFKIGEDNKKSVGLVASVGGSVTINGGTFESANTSDCDSTLVGFILGVEVNINGGIYRAFKGGTFYIGEATVNFKENTPNSIIVEHSSDGQSVIFVENPNAATVNIYSGTFKATDTNLINIHNVTGEIKNVLSVVNIYGGYLENNSGSYPSVYTSGGKVTLSGGQVVNKGGGYTIYNSGGTAIQTGGTSSKNYGVTVQ